MAKNSKLSMGKPLPVMGKSIHDIKWGGFKPKPIRKELSTVLQELIGTHRRIAHGVLASIARCNRTVEKQNKLLVKQIKQQDSILAALKTKRKRIQNT